MSAPAFGVLTGLTACAAVLTASFVTVLCRGAVQRLLCVGASVVPLCGRRHRERSFPSEGDLLGDGRRHLRRHHRYAARHRHQGSVAALSVRRHVPGAGGAGGRVGRRADPGEDSKAAAAHGVEPGPPIARNRAPATLHHRGRLRRRQLFHDEHGDDIGAARDGRMQSLGDGSDARHPVAHAGHVCAEPRDRFADPAVRRRAHDRSRARPASC